MLSVLVQNRQRHIRDPPYRSPQAQKCCPGVHTDDANRHTIGRNPDTALSWRPGRLGASGNDSDAWVRGAYIGAERVLLPKVKDVAHHLAAAGGTFGARLLRMGFLDVYRPCKRQATTAQVKRPCGTVAALATCRDADCAEDKTGLHRFHHLRSSVKFAALRACNGRRADVIDLSDVYTHLGPVPAHLCNARDGQA